MTAVRLLADMGESRGSYIGSRVTKTTKALEIGGSYNPMFRRSDGYDLWTADHDSQQNLIAKYADTNAGAGRLLIEHVDFVATDGNLDTVVPDEHAGTFQFVLSSHNIEHLPNPIAHLRSVERLLAADGAYLMVAPDKRGCFDLLRPMTTTGEWLEAFLKPQPFHSLRTQYDCESYSVGNHRHVTWHEGTVFDGLEIASGLQAHTSYQNILTPVTEYRDGHAWNFTPHSMLLILREIHALGLTSLYPDAILSDGNGEFIAELVRRPATTIDNTERVSLLARACREQAEAHMQIVV